MKIDGYKDSRGVGRKNPGGGKSFLLRGNKLQKNLVIVKTLAITYFLSRFFLSFSVFNQNSKYL